jgi:hypothetical protein
LKKLIPKTDWLIKNFLSSPSQWYIAKLTETKVASRKARVRIAIVFIAALSLRAASLIRTVILLSCWATMLKASCKSVILLKCCEKRSQPGLFRSVVSFRWLETELLGFEVVGPESGSINANAGALGVIVSALPAPSNQI